MKSQRRAHDGTMDVTSQMMMTNPLEARRCRSGRVWIGRDFQSIGAKSIRVQKTDALEAKFAKYVTGGAKYHITK